MKTNFEIAINTVSNDGLLHVFNHYADNPIQHTQDFLDQFHGMDTQDQIQFLEDISRAGGFYKDKAFVRWIPGMAFDSAIDAYGLMPEDEWENTFDLASQDLYGMAFSELDPNRRDALIQDIDNTAVDFWNKFTLYDLFHVSSYEIDRHISRVLSPAQQALVYSVQPNVKAVVVNDMLTSHGLSTDGNSKRAISDFTPKDVDLLDTYIIFEDNQPKYSTDVLTGDSLEWTEWLELTAKKALDLDEPVALPSLTQEQVDDVQDYLEA